MLAEAHVRAVPAANDFLLDNLMRRALRHHLSLVQQQNLVGPQGGEVEIVQHHADM